MTLYKVLSSSLRSCPICERDEEIAELRASVASLLETTVWIRDHARSVPRKTTQAVAAQAIFAQSLRDEEVTT